MPVRSIVLLAVLVSLASCTGWGGMEKTAEPPAAETCTGAATMAFDPRPSVNFLPWPTDLLTTPDAGSHTGKRLHIEAPYPPIVADALTNVAFVRDPLPNLDGFSTTSRIFAPVGGELASWSLPDLAASSSPDAAVQLIVTDESSPRFGERLPAFVTFRPEISHLEITPLRPLDGATRHAVVVTTATLGADGNPACPSPEFAYVARTDPDPGVKYFDELEPVRLIYRDVFDRLESIPSPVPRARLSLAFEFTTTDTTTDMARVSAYILDRARAFPPRGVDFVVNPSGGDLNAVVTGSFPSPDFRDAEGVFNYDPEWKTPYSERDELLDFLMLLPEPRDGAEEQPFPVVLCLHGINSTKEMCYSLSDQAARRGYAVVAIDFVAHGSRGTGDEMFNGFKFIEFLRPLVMRDNIRQTVADELQTVQFVKTLADMDVYPYNPETGETGDGVPDLDTGNLLLFGHSLGGILAPLLLATSPDLNTCVAAPAAGAWADIAIHSYYTDVVLSILNLFIDGLEFPESLRLALEVANISLDPASNVNYIRHVLHDPLPIAGGTKEFLLQEAINDETLPNESTDILAFDGGFPLLDPYVQLVAGLDVAEAPVEHFGMFQYAEGGHGYYFGGPSRDAARLQAEVFWESYLRDGAGRIIDPGDPTQVPDWFVP
jgi:pimeloyl-ACP methyl ester carboxylesterase